MKAKAVNKAFSYSGIPTITFEIEDRDFLNNDMLDGRDLDLTIKVFRKKRSLNANAYMWALINQIASVMSISNDEVYHRMLCDYGTYEKTDSGAMFISVRADIKLTGWLYTHTKPIKTVELEGKYFTHYTIIKGSSEYDTKEMSVLLDGVIEEAKELGIETLDNVEIERLISEWNQ